MPHHIVAKLPKKREQNEIEELKNEGKQDENGMIRNKLENNQKMDV